MEAQREYNSGNNNRNNNNNNKNSNYNSNTANQNCMALTLVRCSIEVDQEGTLYAKARVSLVSWEGGSHAVLFMVPLGPPSARAQALRLPFEYYYNNNTQIAALPHPQLREKLFTFKPKYTIT